MQPKTTMVNKPVGADTYSSAMGHANNYMSWLLEEFGSHLAPPILEIGVGHGSYVKVLQNLGPYMGVDIDADSVLASQRIFPSVPFQVADITTDEFLSNLNGKRFQSVVCLNVLEHINEHSKAVRNLARSLGPGGHLLIVVPALPTLYNDLDRLAGHIRRYKRNELSKLLEESGLEIVRCDYFNSIGGFGWWINKLKRHHSLNDYAVNAQIILFDRWILPFSRAIDPFTRKLFGQSLIAVGRRP